MRKSNQGASSIRDSEEESAMVGATFPGGVSQVAAEDAPQIQI